MTTITEWDDAARHERIRRLRELRESTNKAWWHASPRSAERERLAAQEASIAQEIAETEAARDEDTDE